MYNKKSKGIHWKENYLPQKLSFVINKKKYRFYFSQGERYWFYGHEQNPKAENTSVN